LYLEIGDKIIALGDEIIAVATKLSALTAVLDPKGQWVGGKPFFS
jgi:hypothetical protein